MKQPPAASAVSYHMRTIITRRGSARASVIPHPGKKGVISQGDKDEAERVVHLSSCSPPNLSRIRHQSMGKATDVVYVNMRGGKRLLWLQEKPGKKKKKIKVLSSRIKKMHSFIRSSSQYVPPVPTSGSKLNSVVEVDESQVGMVMIGVGDGFEVPDTHARIEVWLAMARRGRLENAFFRPFGAGQEAPRLTIAQTLGFFLFHPKPLKPTGNHALFSTVLHRGRRA